jgi:hypothetical protein
LQQQLQLQVQELKEENEKDKIVEQKEEETEKLELDLAKVEDQKNPAQNDDDDLISAMMATSLHGGAISDMPSPTDL